MFSSYFVDQILIAEILLILFYPFLIHRGFVRFLNVRDAYGATPLHLAARGGHISVVKHLLENGALVSATTTTTGNA